MYTSTTFGSPAKSMPHTWSRISRFDATLPSRRMRYSSSANSRAVSLIDSPLRSARRVPGSSRNGPTSSTAGRGGAPRRNSARKPGEEHHERERLREEVVGAGVERLGLVPLAVLRGEHEDRRPHAFVAQGLADLVAVHPRQEDVEDDGVVGALACAPQAVGAVVDDVDVVALGLQAVLDGLGQRHFVFDDQHSHVAIVPLPGRRRAAILRTPAPRSQTAALGGLSAPSQRRCPENVRPLRDEMDPTAKRHRMPPMWKTPRTLLVSGAALVVGLGVGAAVVPALAAQDPVLTPDQQSTLQQQSDAYKACLEQQGVTLPAKPTDGTRPELSDEQKAALRAGVEACREPAPEPARR